MTELERWMNDHPPLADALTAEETAALRAKVLARRPRVHVLRGWRLAAAAAALCLVAAGAVVLGLCHPLSAATETNALVQKYGEVLDEPLTAEINGHTVSVKALLRGQYTLRIVYDVDNARGMEGDDLVWDTANFTLYKPKGASERKWDYGASNVDVGPISGYAVGPWDGRYEASENDTLSCFVDIPLLYEKGNSRTLYIGDLTNYSAKASVKITLPDAPPTLTVDVKKTIALKGGHWFHYDMTDEEAEQYPDATFDIQEVRIEPLAVSVIGNVLLALWNSGAFDGKEQPATPVMERSLEGYYLPAIEDELEQMSGYNFIYRYEYSDTYPSGVIYKQSLAVGQVLPEDGSVTLYISKGPQYTVMPDLYGANEAYAIRILTDCQISYTIVYDTNPETGGEPGTVVGTSIAPGSPVGPRTAAEVDTVTVTIKGASEEPFYG